MKKTVALLLSLLTTHAMAAGFICTEDNRARDGSFQEIELLSKGSSHDLMLRTMARKDATVKETLLASGLTCNFSKDARLAYCFKASADTAGESTMLLSRRVDTTQVRPGDSTGTTLKASSLLVALSLPGMDASKTQYDFQMTSCKAN